MNEIDYINQVVGTPWLKASDDIANGGLDCWGVVVDSFLNIEGIKLPTPPWRQECETGKAGDAAIESGCYTPCECENGAIFAVYRKGAMVHVGRVLSGLAVHSDGSTKRPSSCKSESVKDMVKCYERFGMEIKYFRYEGK